MWKLAGVSFFVAFLMIYATTCNAWQSGAESGRLVGIWGGEMRLGGKALDVDIEFQVNDAGEHSARIVSKGGGQATPITNVVFNPPYVTFQLNSSGMPMKFDGELSGDTLEGPLSVEMLNQALGELSLKRTPDVH